MNTTDRDTSDQGTTGQGVSERGTPPRGPDRDTENVTQLELFFDLIFVFAITQITGFLAHHLTWSGVGRGLALLAVVWWSWVVYSWLTNAVAAEEMLSARLTILTAMAAMLVVALSTPRAFGEDAALFGISYFVVRLLQVALYALVTPPETRDAILRLAPGFLGGPALLIAAGFVAGPAQDLLWVVAILIDYGVAFVRSLVGFHVRAGHFVERYRLVVIVALGESIVAIGVGVGNLTLAPEVVLAALLGFVLVATLWWLYFDFITLAAERRFTTAPDHERTVLARDSYSYIHLAIIGGIVFVALGIEQTLARVGDPLGLVPTVALCGGGALYLSGHNAYRLRDHRTFSGPRLLVAVLACALIPVTRGLPALVTLALLTLLFVALAAFETRSELRYEFRARI